MNEHQTGLGVVVAVLLVGILVSQQMWHWLPASSGGLPLWRIVAICFAVWLFYLGFTAGSSKRWLKLARAEVRCGACGEVTVLATWQSKGRCPACGHDIYEYVGGVENRYAQVLPGAVELAPPAPPPDPRTPVARPKHRPHGRLLDPLELARTRLGMAERKRVRGRLTQVLVDRDKVFRV